MSAPDCEGCTVAEANPASHLFINGCPVCEARAMSQEPKHRRDAFYAAISDPEEREAMKTAVQLAYARRKAAA